MTTRRVRRCVEMGREMRVVVWDGRGTGPSDPLTRAPTLDDRVRDLVCVLDAAEVEQAALFGVFTGGVPSIVLAATDPDRVDRSSSMERQHDSQRTLRIFRGDSHSKELTRTFATSRTIGAMAQWRSWCSET